MYTEWSRTELHVAASTCLEHLRITAERFDLFENAMVWVQYPGTNTTSSCLNHCNRFSHCCAILSEEIKKQRNRRFAGLATCRFGTSAMLSDSISSLVTDENTRE